MRLPIFIALMAALLFAPARTLDGTFLPAEATPGQPLTLMVVASADTAGRYALTLIYPPQLTYLSIKTPDSADCSTFRAHDWETICYTDLVSGTPALFTVQFMAAPCQAANMAVVKAYLVPNGSFDVYSRDLAVPVRAGWCAYLPKI